MSQGRELLTPFAMLKICGSGNRNPELAEDVCIASFEGLTYQPNAWDPPVTVGVRLVSFPRHDYGEFSVHGRIDFIREDQPPQSWELEQSLGILQIFNLVEGAPKSILLTEAQAKRSASARFHSLLLAELVLKPGARSLSRIYTDDIDFSKSRTIDSYFFETTGDAVATLVALNQAINRARRSERSERRTPTQVALSA